MRPSSYESHKMNRAPKPTTTKALEHREEQ